MPEDYLSKCLALASDNRKFYDRATSDVWRTLEQEIGLVFPESHKEFVSAFGSGAFGSLVFLNPAGKGPFTFSKAILAEIKDTWEALPEMGMPIYPDKNGCVVVADTAANTCYVLSPDQTRLQEELIELYLSAHHVENFKMGAAEFVYKAYTGTLGQSLTNSIWGGYSTFFEASEH